jgi:hypothetical protein
MLDVAQHCGLLAYEADAGGPGGIVDPCRHRGGGLPPCRCGNEDAYGQILWWTEAGAAATVLGANRPIVISTGRMHYETFCSNGKQDFIYPATDVYIVPTGTVELQGELSDAGGGGPNTVIADASGIFIDEPVGVTGPQGKIGPGVYDIVYDECQDGKFGLNDALFERALTVTADPVNAPPIANLTLLKTAAGEMAEDIKKLSDRLAKEFDAAAEVDPNPINKMIKGLGTKVPFIADPRQVVLLLYESQVKHYEGIRDDPSDAAFRKQDVLAAREVADPRANDAFDIDLARLATAEGAQGAGAEALLHAIERYQGAAAAGDGGWELSHARSIRGLASAVADQAVVSSADAATLRSSVATAGLPSDAEVADLQAFADRIKASGFTADELRLLRDLGADDTAITALRGQFASLDVGDATVGNLQAALDDLISAQSDLTSSLRSLASAMGPVVASLEAAAAPAPPVADAGGPYSGSEGESATLHGSASAPGSQFRWDLDGDGLIDDATGPAPTVQLGLAREGFVGMEATDASGLVGVAYTTLSVRDADHRPVLDSSSPAGSDVTLDTGASQLFSVDVHDPEGQAVSTAWALGGVPAGSGATFTYSPDAIDIGPHHLEATSTDSSSLGGGLRRLWNVTVIPPAALQTPPLIVAAITPRPTGGGWNNTDVTVGWSVFSLESGVASSSGCGSRTLSAETTGTPLTCSATSGAGVFASRSVTVKIDKTAPSTTATTSRPVNGTMTATLSAADTGGSGVKEISYATKGAQTGSGVLAGANGSVPISVQGRTYLVVSAVDMAGNHEAPKVLVVDNDTLASDYVVGSGYAVSVFAKGFATIPAGTLGPIGLAFDSTDNLFVSDYADGNLYKFGPAGGTAGPGTKVSASPIGGSLAGLTFTADGRLYSARQSAGLVQELSPATGVVLRSVASVPCATGIATDPFSGDLFVSDGGGCGGTIKRISNYAAGPGTVSTYAPGFYDGLAFGPDGTLYAAGSGTVYRIGGTTSATPGAVSTIATVPTGDGIGVAASSDPSKPVLFVNRNDGKITKVDLTASPPTLTDIVANGTRGDFVTAGPDGCLYAVQSATVLKVTGADGSCSLVPTGVVPRLTLSPLVSVGQLSATSVLTAAFVNVAIPPGTPVSFTVTGANPQTSTAAVDASGHAALSYAGTHEGVDQVLATAVVAGRTVTSNPASVVWTPPPTDITPPTTTATPSPVPNDFGWNNTDVSVGLSAADEPGGSGVKEIHYSLAGASSGAAIIPGSTGSVPVTAVGVSTLTYFATDQAGNQEPPTTLTVRVDKAAPTTTAVAVPAANGAGWAGGAVTVKLAAADEPDGSGVRNIHYQLSGAQTGEATAESAFATTTISAQGTTTVTYSASDRAGNQEPSKTLTIRVDKTPPTTYALRSPLPDESGVNHGPVTITLQALDVAGSGIERISYTLDGAQTGGGTAVGDRATVPVSAEGTMRVTYAAVDHAGNQEPSQTFTVVVSTGAPAAVLNPASLGFGTVRTGTTSASQTVTLTSSGNAALTVDGLSLGGANPADFAIPRHHLWPLPGDAAAGRDLHCHCRIPPNHRWRAQRLHDGRRQRLDQSPDGGPLGHWQCAPHPYAARRPDRAVQRPPQLPGPRQRPRAR